MTFDQLQQLIIVVEQKSFMDAADTLHMSQSSLSKSIIKLERELDQKLFDRSHRSAVLTPIGQIVYHDAKKIYSLYKQMLHNVENIQFSDSVTLFALPSLLTFDLYPALKEFRNRYPNVSIVTQEFRVPTQFEANELNNCSFLIARNFLFNVPNTQKTILMSDELVALVPKSHPLAQESTVDWEQLREEEFITDVESWPYQFCRPYFTHYHFYPRIAISTKRRESIFAAVSAGYGIGILFRSDINMFCLDNIKLLSFKQPIYDSYILAMPVEKQLNPSEQLLYDYLVAHFAQRISPDMPNSL